MSDSKKVPPLWIEQAALNELSESQRAQLRARMSDEELAAYEASLQQSNATILRELPASRMVASIQRRAARQRHEDRIRTWLPAAWSLAPVLSLAAILVVVHNHWTSEPSASTEHVEVEPTRIKGLTPHLVVYRKAGASVEKLAEGAKVRAGDVLQLAYVAAADRYGVVISIDGAGAVTMHLSSAAAGTPLATPRETLLGESYQLDAAPAFERFFFVTAEHAFDPAVVEAAARALASQQGRAARDRLALPPELKQASFTVTKVQP